jgi:hypothetical protein
MTRRLIVAMSLSLFCFAGCDFVPELPARFKKKDASEQTTETKTKTETQAGETPAPEAAPAGEDEKTSWLWGGRGAQAVAFSGGDRLLMRRSEEGAAPELARRTCRHEDPEREPASSGMIRIGEDGIVIPGILRIDDEGVFLSNGLRVTDEGVHVPGVVTVDDDGVTVHGVVQVDGRSSPRKRARERARERLLETPTRRVF